MTLEQPTLIRVPATVPSAYYEYYAAEIDLPRTYYEVETKLLETLRVGDQGRSDAQYILDRIASGLLLRKDRRVMSKYQEAVAWIALNDDAGADHALDVEDVNLQLTVALVADVFNKPDYKVAEAVVAYRKEAQS